MDYTCGKFGDCSFSLFDFIVRTNTQTESHTDADTDERLTPACFVYVSNNNNHRLTAVKVFETLAINIRVYKFKKQLL